MILCNLGFLFVSIFHLALTQFCLGFLRVAQLGETGGGGAESACGLLNSKAINDNEMKLGGVVKDH